MKGIVLATSTLLALYAFLGLCLALGQDSELGARMFALLLLPTAVVAVTAARAGGRR